MQADAFLKDSDDLLKIFRFNEKFIVFDFSG